MIEVKRALVSVSDKTGLVEFATRLSAAGVELAYLYDGTSNTILFVEAKRDIPWTKPEDIAYDPDKELPAFGGFFEHGFNILMLDGSSRFIAKGADEKVIRAIITAKGGESTP